MLECPLSLSLSLSLFLSFFLLPSPTLTRPPLHQPTKGRVAFRAGARDPFVFHNAPIGALKTVTVGYTPHAGEAPWVPTAVWVTVGGKRTCWVVDGGRGEIGGKGWPNQRTLVHRPGSDTAGDGDGVGDDAYIDSSRLHKSSKKGRPHSVDITPSGLVVQCWTDPADPTHGESTAKKALQSTDCWNTDYVPASQRKKTKGKKKGAKEDAENLKKNFDMIEVKSIPIFQRLFLFVYVISFFVIRTFHFFLFSRDETHDIACLSFSAAALCSTVFVHIIHLL